MTPWNIIVAALREDLPAAESVGARLTAAWTGARPLHVTTMSAREIDEEELDKVGGVVLVDAGDGGTRGLTALLTTLEESGAALMAVLASPPAGRNPFSFAGALVESMESDDTVLASKLGGMLHRQREITHLRKEVSIAHRFQGGLRGEIARMHEELQLAAMVQREFLPRELPSLNGVEFAALWRPAHYVSGDIYDVARLDDDHVGLFVADAVGHGVPAALMTMVICRSLRTKVITDHSYRILEPSEVLEQLNTDMIRRQGRSPRFCTAVYAVVNTRSRIMRLAGAGHPPPLVLGRGGSRVLDTEGGLLGIFEEETYAQIELPLDAGDRLLFYSDGFEQAFPDPAEGAQERRIPTRRYLEEFEQLAQEPSPQHMIDRIGRRIDDQSGSLHQLDDLTLVCMHAGPVPAAAPDAPASAPPSSRGSRSPG